MKSVQNLSKKATPDPESFLEAGLMLFGLGLVGGLAVLLLGRVSGGMRRSRRMSASPPAAGSIPGSRHQNIDTTAAR